MLDEPRPHFPPGITTKTDSGSVCRTPRTLTRLGPLLRPDLESFACLNDQCRLSLAERAPRPTLPSAPHGTGPGLAGRVLLGTCVRWPSSSV